MYKQKLIEKLDQKMVKADMVKINKEETKKIYEAESIKINPEFFLPWYNRGIALLELEEYYEAITCFDKVIMLDPQVPDAWVPDAWLNKGNSLEQLGKYAQALTCYEKVLILEKRDDEECST